MATLEPAEVQVLPVRAASPATSCSNVPWLAIGTRGCQGGEQAEQRCGTRSRIISRRRCRPFSLTVCVCVPSLVLVTLWGVRMQRVMTCKDLGWYLSTPRTEKTCLGPGRGTTARQSRDGSALRATRASTHRALATCRLLCLARRHHPAGHRLVVLYYDAYRGCRCAADEYPLLAQAAAADSAGCSCKIWIAVHIKINIASQCGFCGARCPTWTSSTRSAWAGLYTEYKATTDLSCGAAEPVMSQTKVADDDVAITNVTLPACDEQGTLSANGLQRAISARRQRAA